MKHPKTYPAGGKIVKPCFPKPPVCVPKPTCVCCCRTIDYGFTYCPYCGANQNPCCKPRRPWVNPYPTPWPNPWKYWTGDIPQDNSPYTGDDPNIYRWQIISKT